MLPILLLLMLLLVLINETLDGPVVALDQTGWVVDHGSHGLAEAGSGGASKILVTVGGVVLLHHA